jgi:hypothetical protein
MIIRFNILLWIFLPFQMASQDIEQVILDYYQLIRQEQYYEAMEYNYLARGSEDDKAFIVDLMSSDDETPGYGTMIQEIRVVKVGEVIEEGDRSFASAKVVLSMKMPLGHIKTEDEIQEEMEMMQWSFPDASYDKETKSCNYNEHLNLICIQENGWWMMTDERSFRLGLLEGVMDESVWRKL